MRKVDIHEAKATLLKKKRGIRLGALKGKLPEKLVEDIAKPLSNKDLERLCGGGLEP